METMPTIFENECTDYSEYSSKMLNVEMNDTINVLNKEFLSITQKMRDINNMFERLYLKNKNNEQGMSFIEHELFEERMEGLFYRYQKSKNLLKKGRLLRYYTEEKEKEEEEEKETEILNELRYARNTLAHYGINASTNN